MGHQSKLFEASGEDGYWERAATLTLGLACERMGPHRSKFSRRDFTRRQQLVVLVLRALRDSTYRGVCDFLHAAPGVCEAIGLARVPHFSTLQRFADREDIAALVDELLAALLARLPADAAREVAIDSTGLSPTCASRHDASRRSRCESRDVKVSAGIVCGVMLPCALIVSWGPGPDLTEGDELAELAAAAARPARLYADRGYDSERLHEILRETHGVESIIPPVPKGPGAVVRTRYRAMLHHALPEGYGRRWHVESFFSGMKRITGQHVRARGPIRPLAEAALKVPAYAVHR